MLSPNIRILFDGNHADIPSGFIRDTDFDGKFLKGASSGYGGTGGASTHSHTSSNNHTHTVSNHTHGYTTSNYSAMGDTCNNDGTNWQDHTHTGTSGGLDNTYTSSAANPNFDSASNLPPNYKFIAIKSTGYNMFPINGCAFAQVDLTGLTTHAASNGKIVSISAASADAGDGGGSTTHPHTFSHDHGNIAHNHATANSNTATGNSSGGDWNSASDHASIYHVHSTSFTANNAATGTHASSYNFSGIEPLNYGLKVVKNESGAIIQVPVSIIAFTTEATNPIGWITCDGNNGTPNLTDYYIKNTTVDLTAGANTHTHSQAHTHSTAAHAHTFSTATNTGNGYQGVGPNQSDKWSRNHNHGTGTTSTEGASTSGSGTINADAANNEPPYIKVRFIKMQFTMGGSAIAKMLN